MKGKRFPKLLRSAITYLLLFSFVRLACAADIPPNTFTEFQDKISKAETLYYDLEYKDSEKLLNETILALDALPKTPEGDHCLKDAYLVLAFNQFAQSKNKEMNKSLAQAVTYEPERDLDSFKYPPTFIKLFNQQKDKYLLAQANLPKKEKSKKEKKPFYKTWPFFLLVGVVVAGGGAGAAIALSGGGGGGGGNGGGASGPVTVGGTPQGIK